MPVLIASTLPVYGTTGVILRLLLKSDKVIGFSPLSEREKDVKSDNLSLRGSYEFEIA